MSKIIFGLEDQTEETTQQQTTDQTQTQQTGQTNQQLGQAGQVPQGQGKVSQLQTLQIDNVVQSSQTGEPYVPDTEKIADKDADITQLQYGQESLRELIAVAQTADNMKRIASTAASATGIRSTGVKTINNFISHNSKKFGIASNVQAFGRESFGMADDVSNAVLAVESLSSFIKSVIERIKMVLRSIGKFFKNAFTEYMESFTDHESQYNELERIIKIIKAHSASDIATAEGKVTYTFDRPNLISILTKFGDPPSPIVGPIYRGMGLILEDNVNSATAFLDAASDNLKAISSGSIAPPDYFTAEIPMIKGVLAAHGEATGYAPHNPKLDLYVNKGVGVDSYPGNCAVFITMPKFAKGRELNEKDKAEVIKDCNMKVGLLQITRGATVGSKDSAQMLRLSRVEQAMPDFKNMIELIKAIKPEIVKLQEARASLEANIAKAESRLMKETSATYLQSLMSYVQGFDALFITGSLGILNYADRVMKAALAYSSASVYAIKNEL